MQWCQVTKPPCLYHFDFAILTLSKVLLRVLEYYDGILILTTNRMKSFDIAVQSRIRKYHPPCLLCAL